MSASSTIKRLVRQAVVDAAMHDANIFQNRERGGLSWTSAFAWADIAGAGRRPRRVDRQSRRRARSGSREAAVRLHRRRRWPACAAGSTATTRTSATCLSGRGCGVLCIMLEQLGAVAGPKIAAFRQPGGNRHRQRCVRHRRDLQPLEDQASGLLQRPRGARALALLACRRTAQLLLPRAPGRGSHAHPAGQFGGVMDGALAGFIEAYTRAEQRREGAGGDLVNSGDTARLQHQHRRLRRARIAVRRRRRPDR